MSDPAIQKKLAELIRDKLNSTPNKLESLLEYDYNLREAVVAAAMDFIKENGNKIIEGFRV